jgi:hypothetical protein
MNRIAMSAPIYTAWSSVTRMLVLVCHGYLDTLSCISSKTSAHEGVRHGFAEIPVLDDQCTHRGAHIAVAGSNCLRHGDLQPFIILCLRFRSGGHGVFGVDPDAPPVPILISWVKPPFSAALENSERYIVRDANGVTVAWLFCRDGSARYSTGAGTLTADEARGGSARLLPASPSS